MKLEKIDVKALELDEGEYSPLLSEYFTSKPAVRQNRAIRGKARYIVFQNSDGVYAIEEQGDWDDEIDFREGNMYRWIYRNGTGKVNEEKMSWKEARWIYRDEIGKVNEEKMSWKETRELLSDHSNFSL